MNIKRYDNLRGREVPISIVLREFTQGYPLYFGYRGDKSFQELLSLLFATGVHSIEIDNPYQGDFSDGHVPIKTGHVQLAGKLYGDRVLSHLRLGPGIPDIKYYLEYMEEIQKTGVGLFTTLDYEKIGYESQEDQLKDVENGIGRLIESGVQTVRFSVENGVYYFQNGERNEIENLIRVAIEAGANTIGLPKTNGKNSVDMYRFGQEVGTLVPDDISIRLHCHGTPPYLFVLNGLAGLLTSGHENVVVETTLERSSHPNSVEIPGIVEMNDRLREGGVKTGVEPNFLVRIVSDALDMIYRPSHLPPYELAIGGHAAKKMNGSKDYDGQIQRNNHKRIFSHTTGKNILRDLLEQYGIQVHPKNIPKVATEIRRLMSGDYPDINPRIYLDEDGVPRLDNILTKISELRGIPINGGD